MLAPRSSSMLANERRMSWAWKLTPASRAARLTMSPIVSPVTPRVQSGIRSQPFLKSVVDWKRTMKLLRSRPGQYPMMLELREAPGMDPLLDKAADVRERLADLGHD